jgi:hypothetical protein
MDDLPRAIAEEAITIAGVSVRVAVLEDGRRVLNADDADALFRLWANGHGLAPDDILALAGLVRKP